MSETRRSEPGNAVHRGSSPTVHSHQAMWKEIKQKKICSIKRNA